LFNAYSVTVMLLWGRKKSQRAKNRVECIIPRGEKDPAGAARFHAEARADCGEDNSSGAKGRDSFSSRTEKARHSKREGDRGAEETDR